MDKGTTLKTDLLWARILVKMEGKEKPSFVNILTGVRSYKLQLWWEIQPWVAEIFPLKNKACGGIVESVEEDEWETRAARRVPVGAAGNSRRVQKE